VTHDGDAQRTAEHINLAAEVEGRWESCATDRNPNRSYTPGTTEAVADHDTRLATCQGVQPLT
jgi:hypothetical protein